MTKTWKNTERKIASLMQGKRNTVALQAGDDKKADVEHSVFGVEVKHRKKLPALLFNAMEQAKATADKNKIPVVVLHELNQRHENDFVVLRMSDFLVLCKEHLDKGYK